ncbi:hypothetical protein [Terriglobus sp.]|uniref:hypothetical protein n=1 Tax=Terriglobus sp. TaxID=1889013 RepID=UPI003B000079
MLGSSILDVAIGIVFIFLLSSLIASAMREGLEAWLKTRASHLEAGLREILKDPSGTGLVTHFYNHPLIYSLFSGEYVPDPKLNTSSLSVTRGRNLPSYIPSRNFAIALMDMAARGPQAAGSTISTEPVTLDAIRSNLGSIENPAVQRALLIALDGAAGDLAKAQANLEAWYDSAMDRVSGWYKRSTQIILLVLGLLLAVALNISTVRIGETLYHDKTARDLVVSSAEKVHATEPINYETASKSLGDLSLLVGWPKTRDGVRNELAHYWAPDIAGWLLTAFAVSIGAPFWFDLLNRLIIVRSTVKPHQKSPEDASIESSAATGSGDAVAGIADQPIRTASPLAGSAASLQTAPRRTSQPPLTEIDGCDIDKTTDVTTDEMLPMAAGGVRA